MEIFAIIFALVSVAAAILQIILFFKVWRMCNDIKAIREKECPKNKEEQASEKDYGWVWGLIIFITISLFVVLLSQN